MIAVRKYEAQPDRFVVEHLYTHGVGREVTMRTRARHSFHLFVPVIFGALVTASCGGSTPTVPSGRCLF